jgi:hypothetical protein
MEFRITIPEFLRNIKGCSSIRFKIKVWRNLKTLLTGSIRDSICVTRSRMHGVCLVNCCWPSPALSVPGGLKAMFHCSMTRSRCMRITSGSPTHHHIATWPQKAGILESEKTSVSRQQLGKRATIAKDAHATVEKMLDTVFSISSVPIGDAFSSQQEVVSKQPPASEDRSSWTKAEKGMSIVRNCYQATTKWRHSRLGRLGICCSYL